MVAVPFVNAAATASVTVPRFEIEHTAQSSGGLGSLLDAVTGGAASDPWQSHVVALSFSANRGPRVDTLELTLLHSDEAPSVSIDDEIGLKVGVVGDVKSVFKGRVRLVEWDASGQIKIFVTNDGFLLARAKRNQSFEQQTTGDIMSSLCGDIAVSIGDIERGIDLPFYVVDDSMSLYHHIDVLAQYAGLSIFFDADNAFNAKTTDDTKNTYAFTYGIDVVALNYADKAPLKQGAVVVGTGAASSQGQEAAHWLTKEPQVKSEVSGDNPILKSRRALKSIEASDAYAQGLSSAVSRTRWVDITVAGVPPFHLGDSLELSDTPNGRADGEFIIARFTQHFDVNNGFETRASAYEASAAASGLGGLF